MTGCQPGMSMSIYFSDMLQRKFLGGGTQAVGAQASLPA